MDLFRFSTLLFVFLALSTQTAIAAGGGGGGFSGPGSSGGGKSGARLNETFRSGVELLEDGECKKAEREFRKVLKVVSKNPEANLLRGMTLQCQGRHKAAARYLERAKRYDKKLYVAYQMLGVSFVELGRIDDAQQELDELSEIARDCGSDCPDTLLEARSNLEAAIAGNRGDAPDSEEPESPDEDSKEQHGLLFEPVAEPQTAYLGAVQLIHAERFGEAIEALRRLTETIGPHSDVLNYLGYAHRRLGRFDSARRYYEQALAIDPMHRGANEYLGELWVELGQLAEARRRLARLDEACPFGCAEYEDLRRAIGARVMAER